MVLSTLLSQCQSILKQSACTADTFLPAGVFRAAPEIICFSRQIKAFIGVHEISCYRLWRIDWCRRQCQEDPIPFSAEGGNARRLAQIPELEKVMALYTLHIGNKNYSSWSLRAWLLLKELDITFDEVMHPFDPFRVIKRIFEQFSPSARVPCLVDKDLTIWDTLAIFEYVAERASVWPADKAARAFSRSVCAEIHSGWDAIRTLCPMNCSLTIKTESLPDELQHDVNRLSSVIEEGMRRFKGPFAAGSRFTGLDAFLAPMVVRAVGYQLSLSRYPEDIWIIYSEILGWLSGLERPERSPGENLMRMKRGFEEAPCERLSRRARAIGSKPLSVYGSS